MDTISSIFTGGDTPTASTLSTFVPSNLSSADSNYWNTLNSMQSNNPYLQNQGTYYNIEQQQLNNPYASQAQSAANTAGTAATNAANQSTSLSNSLANSTNTGLSAANNILNTAYDPQNAAYNQQKQAALDTANATNAAYGLSTSPVGANTANQAMTNFQNTWDTNKLARQEAGLTSYDNALSSASSAAQMANNLAASGVNLYQEGGTIPYEQYNSNLSNMLSALNDYGTSQTNANSQTQNVLSDLMQYMNLGASQSNAQAGLTQQNYENSVASTAANDAYLKQLFSSGTSDLSKLLSFIY